MSSVKIQGNASGTGILTIAAPNTNTDRTLTLPDVSGTVALTGGSVDETLNNLTLNGGLYLGGTGAANYLDDYEEGTWTPTVGGTWTTAPTFSTSTYTKIGRLVHVIVYVTNAAAKASSTSGWIDGLPFTVSQTGTGSVSSSNVTDDGNCFAANSTRIWLTSNALTATAYISVTYEVA